MKISQTQKIALVIAVYVAGIFTGAPIFKDQNTGQNPSYDFGNATLSWKEITPPCNVIRTTVNGNSITAVCDNGHVYLDVISAKPK